MTTTNKFIIVLAVLIAALIGFALGAKYSEQLENKMPMSQESKEGEMQAPNAGQEASAPVENKQNNDMAQPSSAN